MNIVGGKTVTVTLNKGSHYNIYKPVLEVGQMIKFKQKKRLWAKVLSSTYSGADLIKIYRPAPKSKLNHKTIFSKVKIKIVKI